MNDLQKDITRKIIEDFAEDIKTRLTDGPKPETTVINFRNEKSAGIVRKVKFIPIDLLRYRKDNGRISSDVMDYEKKIGVLDESKTETQLILEKFLYDKDKEKTSELMSSIKQTGQTDPAIITCDGFLINGNRRRMAMKKLLELNPGNSDYSRMKVVVLPSKMDEGGSPTLLEIEQLENRYQGQKDGKAEYYAFDWAISMRRKVSLGMSLEEQLRDDPVYSGLSKSELDKKVKYIKKEFLEPLNCIDRYLTSLDREKQYKTISKSVGDPEGRWQAFKDYYSSVYLLLSDPKKRMKSEIDEDEIGKIEDIAFKIIRARKIPGFGKLHQIIRDLSKWIRKESSKKELLKLVPIKMDLQESDKQDENGNELVDSVLDKKWAKEHLSEITSTLKKAKRLCDHKIERETPIELLKASLKKLTHEDMQPRSVKIDDLEKSMQLCRDISNKANSLEDEFYKCKKNADNYLNSNKIN